MPLVVSRYSSVLNSVLSTHRSIHFCLYTTKKVGGSHFLKRCANCILIILLSGLNRKINTPQAQGKGAIVGRIRIDGLGRDSRPI